MMGYWKEILNSVGSCTEDLLKCYMQVLESLGIEMVDERGLNKLLVRNLQGRFCVLARVTLKIFV